MKKIVSWEKSHICMHMLICLYVYVISNTFHHPGTVKGLIMMWCHMSILEYHVTNHSTTKGTSQLHIKGPLCCEFPCSWRIPYTKGQKYVKHFHFVTPLWYILLCLDIVYISRHKQQQHISQTLNSNCMLYIWPSGTNSNVSIVIISFWTLVIL